jgi:hypothetical protein
MDYFEVIDDGQAIIRSNGVFRQVPIAVRDGKIYAKYGAGYVKLSGHGDTSRSRVFWHQIDPGEGRYVEKGMSVVYLAPLSAVK